MKAMKVGLKSFWHCLEVYYRTHPLQTLRITMAKAMKAMKVMKKMAAMKAMKVMKKKSVSKVAKGVMAKAMVLRGSKAKTVGGLTAKDLTKNKFGKIVSKKKSALGKKSPWIQAV